TRDWSSDVCSSDLRPEPGDQCARVRRPRDEAVPPFAARGCARAGAPPGCERALTARAGCSAASARPAFSAFAKCPNGYVRFVLVLTGEAQGAIRGIIEEAGVGPDG